MQVDGFFRQYLFTMVSQLPIILVYLVGLALALVWRRRHPRAHLFAILGIAVLLLNLVVMSGVQVWFPRYWMAHTHSEWSVNSLGLTIGVIRSLIAAGGFALLLMAVFIGRPAQPSGQ